MRTRKRIALLLASAGALAVGLIAFPTSAAALPPVVPTCTFPNTVASDSCGRLLATGSPNPIGPGPAYENIRLGIRVRSQLDSGSETQSVILRFDDDIRFQLNTVPGTCTAAQVTGDTIAQAYAQCGPGAGGSNTYLSPAGNVSGVGSTVVTGIDACTMIFKGATVNQVIIYARAPIGNPPSECNNPATNNTGSTTTVFTGALGTAPGQPASPYGRQLTVPNTNSPPVALDDFSATLFRGAAVQARCPAGQNPLKMQGVWDYVPAGDPTDTHNTTDPC